MDIHGPVANSPCLAQNRSKPEGTLSFGTINNCGNGYTPWGTYLATEENFNQLLCHVMTQSKMPKQSSTSTFKMHRK